MFVIYFRRKFKRKRTYYLVFVQHFAFLHLFLVQIQFALWIKGKIQQWKTHVHNNSTMAMGEPPDRSVDQIVPKMHQSHLAPFHVAEFPRQDLHHFVGYVVILHRSWRLYGRFRWSTWHNCHWTPELQVHSSTAFTNHVLSLTSLPLLLRVWLPMASREIFRNTRNHGNWCNLRRFVTTTWQLFWFPN